MPLLLALCNAGLAATLRVEQDGSGDYSAIQDAIDAAAFGDRIEVGPGEYLEALDFGGVELELVSTDGPELTILDATTADGATSTITLTSGEAGLTRVEGFTIRGAHGTARRGLDVAYGEVTVVDVRFDSLDATPVGDGEDLNGGGIRARSAVVVLEDCTFVETRGQVGGAVFLFEASSLRAENVTVESSSAGSGGGVAAADSDVEIAYSAFDGNAASEDGGAIWASGSSVTLTEVSFDTNAAEEKGGVVYLTGDASVVFDGGRMVGNSADDGAALASASVDSAQLLGTEFQGNAGWSLFHVASRGAGELVLDGLALGAEEDVVRLLESTDLGALTIARSSFDGTPALDLSSVGALRVEDSTFYGAGGLVASAGRATLSGVTVHYAGDARFLRLSADDIVIEDSEIADNSALDLELGTLSVVDSLFLRDAGLVVSATDSVSIEGSRFEASGRALDVSGDGAVTVLDSSFVGNAGGLFAGAEIASLSVEDARFEYNVGAIEAEAADVTLRRSWFCDNEDAVQLVEVRQALLSNNVFLRSAAAQDGAAVHAAGVGDLQVINNSFLSGTAARYGGALYVVSSPLLFVNNLVAWTGAGAGLSGNSTAADDAWLVYDGWWQNSDADLGAGFASLALDDTHVHADPALASDAETASCGDALWPAEGSPLLDAGDPDRLDADGSRSDIGAFGGDDPMPADRDGDGYDTDTDCDDADAATHPGATEVAGDGVDNDCADGDAPAEVDDDTAGAGGDSAAGDSADSGLTGLGPKHGDATAAACAGCASGGGGGLLAWMAGLSLLVRRRR